ncbi:MAG: carbamate kinase [Eggerthellaceae bacterium]|jgi:carbamate kinase|nr:carbamate kinase [Eggerthellaceae bacterium]MDR2721679.1 carbamate kinase [Coriobacteriaceae bacterium]
MPYETGNGRKLVIALGGNALGSTPEEQLELVQVTAKSIVDLVDEKYDVIVAHGNGPQVGMIKAAFDFSEAHGQDAPEMPLMESGAMSQGYIGYHLQQAVLCQVKTRNIMKSAATIITQTVVDAADEAFKNPTKPIGSFVTEEVARAKAAQTGYTYKEDAGRGWRQVVASPMPQRIVEFDVVNDLVEAGYIVICAGGGGVPVIEQDGGYVGVPAVIDKDRTSAKLAADAQADMLIILTAVDRVCVDFGKPTQQEIEHMTLAEARQYIAEGQFAPGSMLPKVEACLDYVESYPQGRALITSLEKAAAALRGETGTIISA